MYTDFGGNPKDVESIQKRLLKYDINEKNIYLPLLYGHSNEKRGFIFGITYEKMVEHLQKYITDLSINYDEIILIGYSMGALISMCVSMNIHINKLILINPPIHIWDFKSFRFWLSDDIKKRRLFHIKTVLGSIRYRVIRNNLELGRLRHFTIDNISKITCDTYIIQSTHDYVAKPSSGRFVYENISSNKIGISYYTATSHFIPSEQAIDVVVEDIYNWINEN